MKKNNLFTLLLAGVVTTGISAPYTTLNHNNVANATDKTAATNKTLDIKNLKDGEYSFDVKILNFSNGKAASMADGAVKRENTRLIVRNGQYFIRLSFQPIEHGMGSQKFRGYLGDLKYYSGDKSYADRMKIADNEFKEATIVENYNTNEKDDFFDTYKKHYPSRTAYPKTVEYPVDKNKITADNKLIAFGQVYVPVMDSISEGLGTQNIILNHDFSTLKVIKVTEDPKPVERYVNIHVKDDTIVSPVVRKNVDTIGKLVQENGQEYLVLTYYSKIGEGKNNNGLQNIKYADKAIENAKDSDLKTPTEVKVIQTLKTSESVFEISQAKIPVTGKKEVFVYGDFQYPAGIFRKYGTVTWDDKNVNINKSPKVDAPKLFSLKPVVHGTTVKKAGDPKQEFDFSKDGVDYSPYNGINGDKFKLANNYFFSLEAAFERPSLVNTKTRYLKYTLDGSEPTFSSRDAVARFANANPHKPEFYYNLNIDPFEEGSKVPTTGGNLTLKVKAFSEDGKESSETKTYVLPFDKETLDKTETTVDMDGTKYKATLSSDRKFLLDENARLEATPISEEIINKTLDSKINELGLKNAKTLKLNITKKDGSKFTPTTKNGWNIDENPIFTLKLENYKATTNTHAYIYENGILRPVPTTATVSKSTLQFNVNSDEAYFVIAEKDTKALTEEKVAELKEKAEEAEKILAETTSISTAKSNLEAELQKVKKKIKKNSFTLNAVLLHLENMDKNFKI